MLRVVVLVSGGGTNLQAIMDRIADGTIKNVELVGVISNKPDAYALIRAKEAGIKAGCISPKSFENRNAFDSALLRALDSFSPDLIVLAGYLVILPVKVIQSYRGKIINIHPALLPSFGGTGMYGLHVHVAALAAGVKVTGATVHFVDEGTDTGSILLQKAVEVRPGDTPEELQLRVMQQAEWIILPRAISAIANNQVTVVNGKYWLTDEN